MRGGGAHKIKVTEERAKEYRALQLPEQGSRTAFKLPRRTVSLTHRASQRKTPWPPVRFSEATSNERHASDPAREQVANSRLSGGAIGDGEQERPQRRARDRAAGSGGHDPACACEDDVEPAQADAADQPQVHAEAAVRRGGQHPRHTAELRTLPIRLTPTPTTFRVPPLSRVKLGIGWSRGKA